MPLFLGTIFYSFCTFVSGGAPFKNSCNLSSLNSFGVMCLGKMTKFVKACLLCSMLLAAKSAGQEDSGDGVFFCSKGTTSSVIYGIHAPWLCAPCLAPRAGERLPSKWLRLNYFVVRRCSSRSALPFHHQAPLFCLAVLYRRSSLS